LDGGRGGAPRVRGVLGRPGRGSVWRGTAVGGRVGRKKVRLPHREGGVPGALDVMMWQCTVDELETISSGCVDSVEAMRPRGSTSGPIILSACTGKPLPAAPAAQLEGSGAMSMHTAPTLPACIASADTLAYASHCMFFCSLHRRVTWASNASCQPKTEHGSPRGDTRWGFSMGARRVARHLQKTVKSDCLFWVLSFFCGL
jgi:hypothetical protein